MAKLMSSDDPVELSPEVSLPRLYYPLCAPTLTPALCLEQTGKRLRSLTVMEAALDRSIKFNEKTLGVLVRSLRAQENQFTTLQEMQGKMTEKMIADHASEMSSIKLRRVIEMLERHLGKDDAVSRTAWWFKRQVIASGSYSVQLTGSPPAFTLAAAPSQGQAQHAQQQLPQQQQPHDGGQSHTAHAQVGAHAAATPLPLGWASGYDLTSGMIYYYNQGADVTQWDAPVGAVQQQQWQQQQQQQQQAATVPPIVAIVFLFVKRITITKSDCPNLIQKEAKAAEVHFRRLGIDVTGFRKRKGVNPFPAAEK